MKLSVTIVFVYLKKYDLKLAQCCSRQKINTN